MKIRRAVLPVAGLGTRFLPATKVIPKEMLPILDKPMVQYAVEEAMDAGIEEFIFVTGRGKVMIEDHFDISYELERTLENLNKIEVLDNVRKGIPQPGKAFFTRQQKPLGLGHAIWCARHFIRDEAFAVLLPDDFLLTENGNSGVIGQMIKAYESVPGSMMAAITEVPEEKTSSYGVLSIANNQSDDLTNKGLVKAKGLIEKPAKGTAPSNLAIIGRYILPSDIFNVLEKGNRGVGGEIQITDAMQALIDIKQFYGFKFQGKRFDCGSKMGFLEANIALALSNPSMHDDTIALLKTYSKNK